MVRIEVKQSGKAIVDANLELKFEVGLKLEVGKMQIFGGNGRKALEKELNGRLDRK